MSNPLSNTKIQSGPGALLVEVMKAENGTRFLRVTETKTDGDAKGAPATVLLFGDTCDQFRQGIMQTIPPANRNGCTWIRRQNSTDQAGDLEWRHTS